jgi:hypothetical protein
MCYNRTLHPVFENLRSGDSRVIQTLSPSKGGALNPWLREPQLLFPDSTDFKKAIEYSLEA